jgi:glutamate synthase domain-containing protein 1/glutamate synthase domain-containing protein 3
VKDMSDERSIRALLSSRRHLPGGEGPALRKADAEGGCGVIGLASSVPVAGRHLLEALAQMRNRGNGKGGGVAAAGLDPAWLGVPAAFLAEDYLLAVALLDESAWDEVRREVLEPAYVVDHSWRLPVLPDWRALPGLTVPPPAVICSFVRVREEARQAFVSVHGLESVDREGVDDEIVYQTSYRLNKRFYASTGEKRAFVLSHGKDLLVLKMVGHGDDVVRCYCLEDLPAHVWIGHHRYPTKGKVWHPGGAHPFIGMHEALVHNGDFANYASMVSFLAQRNIRPLFLTDTEVAALTYDLLHRTYAYPLEYVIEALAPTTERDLAMLPPDRRRTYEMLQAVHVHGSPDGPWFFLIAGHDPRDRSCRLVGITDTSMLRPQVFALQQGEASIGLAASEKQGIDAALASLAREDRRFWTHPDLVWNARGGSHTDGGAFIFTVRRPAERMAELVCTDKFGTRIEASGAKRPPTARLRVAVSPEAPVRTTLLPPDLPAEELAPRALQALSAWDYAELDRALDELVEASSGDGRARSLAVLTALFDRRVPTGEMKRSAVMSLVDAALARVFDGIRSHPDAAFHWAGAEASAVTPAAPAQALVLDARGFPPEGPGSLARAVVEHVRRGWSRIVVAHARGHRFIGNGLSAAGMAVRIDVYGSSGDYLASGLDAGELVVHGSGQDQLAQIMKGGRLVIHGDVGQAFGYAAKGGEVFVLGSAAGRPLINAVGRPRVVINGTCLDYLAESFMAGDPLNGGGFVLVNGVRFDEDGALVDLEVPYPGGNLFSLASGGAIYLRDPRGRVDDDQLNGGRFVELGAADWELLLPLLQENERQFGISVARLLSVDGVTRLPAEVYRKIAPARHTALAPEEAWVRRTA